MVEKRQFWNCGVPPAGGGGGRAVRRHGEGAWPLPAAAYACDGVSARTATLAPDGDGGFGAVGAFVTWRVETSGGCS